MKQKYNNVRVESWNVTQNKTKLSIRRGISTVYVIRERQVIIIMLDIQSIVEMNGLFTFEGDQFTDKDKDPLYNSYKNVSCDK